MVIYLRDSSSLRKTPLTWCGGRCPPRHSSSLCGKCPSRVSPAVSSAAMTGWPRKWTVAGGVRVCQGEEWRSRVRVPWRNCRLRGEPCRHMGGTWEEGVLQRTPGAWQAWEPSTAAWGRGRRPVGERLSDFQERKFYPRLLSLGFISR